MKNYFNELCFYLQPIITLCKYMAICKSCMNFEWLSSNCSESDRHCHCYEMDWGYSYCSWCGRPFSLELGCLSPEQFCVEHCYVFQLGWLKLCGPNNWMDQGCLKRSVSVEKSNEPVPATISCDSTCRFLA